MRRFLPLALLAFLPLAHAAATTWQVGPTRTYTKPGAVSTLVHDGDTVEIDAGIYESDVARWSANNLVLKGVGGYAHLKSNGTVYGGKAIWVIAGNNTTVDSIEFSLAACPDHNGAGIRQEGINLTVLHCNFHNNEDGILAGDNPTSNILIAMTEFNHNGYGDGYSHNLYINHINRLTFEYNYSHNAPAGHELKSRAYNNYILFNRLANEADGTASREIDLPNGGTAYIIGNEIEQGPHSENGNIVGYGLEGLINPGPQEVYLINNTIVNDRGNGSFLNIQDGTGRVAAYNNIFAGSGSIIVGTATVVDSSNNLVTNIAGAGFANAAAYDYHPVATSPAINNGRSAGLDTMLPTDEYMHPRGVTSRAKNGRIDIGAHEYAGASGVELAASGAAAVSIVPNPGSTFSRILFAGAAVTAANRLLAIHDALGRSIRSITIPNGVRDVMVDNLAAGVYFVVVSGDGMGTVSERLIVLR